jgi:UDP:flavonoid glycosyltransferase YjiC (YdhE family)
MSHIAVITTGLTGILNASFEVASRLEAEGHRVTYLCPWDVREKVEKQGFTYVQLPHVNFHFFNHKGGKSTNLTARFTYHIKNLSNHFLEGKKMLKIGEFKKILENVKPDKALIDVELHELIFSAFDLKIQTSLLSQWFSNRMHLKLPPLQTAIIPNEGLGGSKMGILFAWIYQKIRIYRRIFVNIITFKNYRRSVLIRYAREIGFPTKSLSASNFPPVFNYDNLPILSMVMAELEFPHSVPKNVSYIGAKVFDSRDEKDQDHQVFNRLHQIFTVKRLKERKLIYCSVSSLKRGDTAFLKKVIRAIKDEREWLLIMSLGGNLSIEDFQPIPENIYLFNWVPQLAVLKEADCSINHGGIHTINECIHFSVPMLVYSGKRFDQNGCGARVVYHGIGIGGDKDLDSELSIKTKTRKLLTEGRYKENMDRMHEVYNTSRDKNLTALLA